MIAGNIAISGANIQPTDFKFASRHWTDLVQEGFVQNTLRSKGMHLGIAKVCFNKIYKSIKKSSARWITNRNPLIGPTILPFSGRTTRNSQIARKYLFCVVNTPPRIAWSKPNTPGAGNTCPLGIPSPIFSPTTTPRFALLWGILHPTLKSKLYKILLPLN